MTRAWQQRENEAPFRARRAFLLLALFFLLSLPGCGGGDGSEEETGPTDASPPGAEPRGGDDEGRDSDGGKGGTPDRPADPTVQVRRTVARYVAALSTGNGERACSLLDPEALDDIKLPEQRAGCAASLTASIGYRDPRGLPQFERAELAEVVSVRLSGARARATATVVSFFADRDEPSIEDDVIYLRRSGVRWLVEKPSGLLHRAIGAEIPLEALRAPGG